MAKDLDAGHPVAFGLECPLFVPLPQDSLALGKAREGESSRSWSAGAGIGALATGLVQAAWILRRIRAAAKGKHQAFLDWRAFQRAKKGLFLWEAFVSGTAKWQLSGNKQGHAEDAAAGLRAFDLGILSDPPVTAVQCRGVETYSLIGAAMLRTGWSQDIEDLARPCLVFKAE